MTCYVLLVPTTRHADLAVHFLPGIVLMLLASLQATNCRISGSDLIENLHLDQRFCLAFKVTLTWDSADSSSHNGSRPSSVQVPQLYGTGHIQVKKEINTLYRTAVLDWPCSISQGLQP